ncbi:hypothetical protein, partial [Intestinibacter sp.]|uniref:hypothetical protein n=1 Tax=Intestinibacter sp. TaxID=1965304 RepID=UPI003F136A38
MTREEIEQLNGVEPYCIETDREQSWYEFGLVQGLETADENPKSPWISVKDDLPCYYTEFYRRIGNILYTRKCLVILSDGSIM